MDRAALLAADRTRARIETALLTIRTRLAGLGHPAEISLRGDEGDAAAQSERRDVAEDELGRLLARGSRLERALERLAADEYGVCLDCAEAIAPKRLEAIPEVERCIECQELLERQAGDQRRRPVTASQLLVDVDAPPARKGGRR